MKVGKGTRRADRDQITQGLVGHLLNGSSRVIQPEVAIDKMLLTFLTCSVTLLRMVEVESDRPLGVYNAGLVL